MRGAYFVMQYVVSFLSFQSSWWERERERERERAGCFTLIVFMMSCFPVSFIGFFFSWRCHGLICSMWLWYFLTTLTFVLKGISDSLITSISYAFIYSIIFLIILPTKFSAWYQSISEFAKQGVTIAFRSGWLWCSSTCLMNTFLLIPDTISPD